MKESRNSSDDEKPLLNTSSWSSSSDDDAPLNLTQAPLKRSPSKPPSTKNGNKRTKLSSSLPIKKEDNTDEDDVPLAAKPTIRPKKETNGQSFQLKTEPHGFLCSSSTLLESGIKWTSLEHNGVLFPPPYKPLPSHVKLIYNGKTIDLPPEVEEVAGFFGAMLDTEHAKNPLFQKNFFSDFKAVALQHKINIFKKFELCDFKLFHKYYEEQKELKKLLTKEEKLRIKAEKEEAEKLYSTCIIDGRVEKIGNFRIEPPGLFRGRGCHPRTGALKRRVMPENVTINIGRGSPVPKAPEGHTWAEVRHDNTVTWLAMWTDNINNSVKYVFLAANSSLKAASDYQKYEKARKLKKFIKPIRKTYFKELKSDQPEIRQRATAMYLIDMFALRAGNEKGDDEADTVGCCSLRCEHVQVKSPRTVVFDFLGKDSIRYYNEVQVDQQVFKNLKAFSSRPKKPHDLIFDKLNTSKLNSYLSSLMEGLSAKVFRTYNASYTMSQELKKTETDVSIHEKILAYNRANRAVAVLCNHQRSVSKAHYDQMNRAKDKLKALKYERRRVRLSLLNSSEEEKFDEELSKRFDLEVDESDLDDDWVENHEKELVELERDKIRKKFERDNEKLASEGNGKPLPKSELQNRLKEADKLAEQLERERLETEKQGKAFVEVPLKMTKDRLINKIEKLDNRIKQAKLALIDRDENKTTALGTSKINYMDPRITYAWCKRNEVPIEKVFSKTLREKFTWANDVDENWEW